MSGRATSGSIAPANLKNVTRRGWPIVRLTEVLAHRIDAVPVQSQPQFRIAGVYSFARGLFARGPIAAVNTTYKSFHRLHQDDFVISQPKAWEGALARVTAAFDGWFLSPVFPTFRAKDERLYIRFLEWFCRQETVWAQLASRARGMGARRESVSPDAFLALEIPLPPRFEQHRIVDKLDQLSGRLGEARAVASGALALSNALGNSAIDALLRQPGKMIPLADAATVIDPNPSHRYPVYAPDGIPMVSTVNFHGDDDISTVGAQRVAHEFFQQTLGRFGVGEGDLVFSRKGKVGYARLLPRGVRFAMTHTLCVIQPNRQKLRPRFLLHYARSPLFLSFLAGTMNPNVGVPTLGLNVIRAAPLPLPSLEVQERIARQLDATQDEIARVRDFQVKRTAEIDALMPAILDRAFNGEL